MSWRSDVVEKTSTQRGWDPSWAAQENGKETQLWHIEWGSICCSSVPSPTPSHTQPFQIKWEVYFSKKLCCSSLLCCYDSACICISVCIVLHGYTEKLGPQLSSPGEWESNAVVANRVGVNMLQFCSVSNSLSHTTLSNKVRGIFFQRTVSLVFIVLLWFCMHMYKCLYCSSWLYNT